MWLPSGLLVPVPVTQTQHSDIYDLQLFSFLFIASFLSKCYWCPVTHPARFKLSETRIGGERRGAKGSGSSTGTPSAHSGALVPGCLSASWHLAGCGLLGSKAWATHLCTSSIPQATCLARLVQIFLNLNLFQQQPNFRGIILSAIKLLLCV